MRIAILTSTLHRYSGIDRVAIQQAKHFVDQGHDVTLVTLKGDMECPGASVDRLGMPRSVLMQRVVRLGLWWLPIKFRSYASQSKPFDKIYSHQHPMNLLAIALCKKGGEYIYYNHGLAPAFTFRRFWEKGYMRLFKTLARRSCIQADRIISISKFCAKQFKSWTGRDSIVRLNTIDTDRFNTDVIGHTIREKHNLGNTPLLLYIGRISPHKGLDDLLWIFDAVKQEYSNIKLCIIGESSYADYYNTLKERADDDVLFIGTVPDEEVPAWYAASTVYVSASYWEGYNLPLAEAQACGKPAVVYDIGAHPEVLDSRGILVTRGDRKEFVRAILKLLSHEKG